MFVNRAYTYELLRLKKKEQKSHKSQLTFTLQLRTMEFVEFSRELKRRKIIRGDKFSIFYQDNFEIIPEWCNHFETNWYNIRIREFHLTWRAWRERGRRINPFSLTNFPRIASGCFFQPWKRVTVWSNLDWKRDWRIEEREKSERTIRLAW